jgi:Tol biopolymer transport system component
MTQGQSPVHVEDVPIKRGLLLPILLVVFVVGAVGAGVYLLVLREADPAHRVLVLIQTQTHDGHISRWWIEDDAASSSRALSKTVNEALESMRFDIFDLNTRSLRAALQGATDPAQIRSAAQSLHVGHVVMGSVEVVEQLPVKGTQKVRRTLRLAWSIMDVASGDITPVLDPPLELHFSSQDEATALATAWDWATPAMLTHVMLALGKQPRLIALRPQNRRDLSLDEQRAGIMLDDFFAFIEIYAQDFAQAQLDSAAALLNLQDRDASPLPTPRRPLGSALDQEIYWGPGPNGRILLLREPHDPFRFVGASNYSLVRRDEQLILADPDGQNRQPIHTFFSYFRDEGAISADGALIATFLEHPHAAQELVVISTRDGSTRALYVDVANDYLFPRFSPDSAQVAFFRRDPLKQFMLEVIRVDGTQEHPLPLGYDTLAWPTPPAWAADSRALYASLRPLRYNPATIWRFDVQTAAPTPLLGPDAAPPPPDVFALGCQEDDLEDPARACAVFSQGALLGLTLGTSLADDDTPFERVFAFNDSPPDPPPDPRYDSSFTSVSPTPDGAALITREVDRDSATHLGRYDLHNGTYTRLLSQAFDHPQLSPDGRAVAFVAPSLRPDPLDPSAYDSEVFVFHLPDGPLVQATRNHHDDNLHGWAADSRALYLSVDTRAADPDPCDRISEGCEVLFLVPLE